MKGRKTEKKEIREENSESSFSEISCDLMVIGTGMAGMAAAMFASTRGYRTVQAGMTGELNFTSGLLDLLGVHPMEKGVVRNRPFNAIDDLVRDEPEHPYAKVGRDTIGIAMDTFMDFLGENGLPYHREPNRNLRVLTPVGTVKPTFGVPRSMIQGVFAKERKAGCVIFDFHGLKGFSGNQIVEMQKHFWPDLRTVRLKFPDTRGEIFAEHMGRALEMEETRAELVAIMSSHLDEAEFVGLPAVLGIYKSDFVFSDLQERIGRPLFEIPIMPPCVTGLRIRHVFEQKLPEKGVKTFFNHRVIRAEKTDDGNFLLIVGPEQPEAKIIAKGVILASGRFFGKGLHASRHRITETIFGLPVYQPEKRKDWHNRSFFAPSGHQINRAGLETDPFMRPIGNGNAPVYPNLFAAGSILAHHDWKRMKCGSGLSISTAYAAVESFSRWIEGRLPDSEWQEFSALKTRLSGE